jgi:simple sugar transport system ATP-binding protein
MHSPIPDDYSTSCAPAIALRGISKRFGAVKANNDVDLTVARGEIHGIIGENGAGKSTLMSILYGFYEADSGSISVKGELVDIKNANDAIAVGIGMVHQHFMLVDNFSVLENVMLGAEKSFSLATSVSQTRKALAALSDQYGLAVDPDAITGDLPVGLQQRVEILKALYRGAEVLILDEPTGVLTPQEVEQLFDILNTLREQGVSVLLITHKLQEVLAITDKVSVMRAGTMVAERITVDTSKEELAELMVGRKVLLHVDKSPANPQQTLLDVVDISWTDPRGVERLKSINLQLRAGEIVGVAGVSGNGQTELLSLLAGIAPVQQGHLNVCGTRVDATSLLDAKSFRHLGVGHVAEDRHRMGMVSAFSARETAIMGFEESDAYKSSGMAGALGLMSSSRVTEHCETLMAQFDVRPADPHLKSANFSGGNQQKLCIAREMEHQPKVLLVGQPTRGVDIGAIEFIHQQLVELRDAGSAILVVSVELEEVMSLCDRIVVMSEGRIVGEMESNEADAQRLGLMMGISSTSETRS